MDPIASAGALGFVLGLQHATDPDHLVAVATIVSRERRFGGGALVGAAWGVGHMATLGLAGAVVVGFGLRVPPVLESGLELLVAALLVALGVLRLREATGDVDAVPREHLLADHDHGGAEVVHSHLHHHAGAAHAHPHLHPSRPLAAALGAGRAGLAGRAAAIGAVHGLAGSAAISLLALATLPTVPAALACLAVFGLGTLAGMTGLTAALAWPVALASRARRARRILAVGAGFGSIGFGVFYALRLV